MKTKCSSIFNREFALVVVEITNILVLPFRPIELEGQGMKFLPFFCK